MMTMMMVNVGAGIVVAVRRRSLSLYKELVESQVLLLLVVDVAVVFVVLGHVLLSGIVLLKETVVRFYFLR